MNRLPDQLLITSEVAERCRASEPWVRRQVYLGRIPYLKLGGLLRFDPDAIDAYIAAGRSGTS